MGTDEAGYAHGGKGQGAQDVRDFDGVGEGFGGFDEFIVEVADGLQFDVEVEVGDVRGKGFPRG